MPSTIDATRSIRDASARAYLAGDHRQALDLYRCDPNALPMRNIEEFRCRFARKLVTMDPRIFAESILIREYDRIARSGGFLAWNIGPHSETTKIASALAKLESMQPIDIVGLEFALNKATPHQITPLQVADMVVKIMGVR